jgi:hypothetical protein
MYEFLLFVIICSQIGPASAVSFLTKSKLSQATLSEIWILGDSERKQYLDKRSFNIVLKLIALCQDGKEPKISLLNTKTPLPVFEGVTLPQPAVSSSSSTPIAAAAPIPIQTTGNSYAISNEERDRFMAAWASCNPSNGFVNGKNMRHSPSSLIVFFL